MKFETAFKKLIGNEGGFTRAWGDRGNWTSGIVGVGKRNGTKYGISAMSYPHLDIKNLTLDKARRIYKNKYWNPLKIDSQNYPPEIAFDLFDTAVNSGVKQAARLLQKAVGTPADGVIGPTTLKAVSMYKGDGWHLVSRYNGMRLHFMSNISFWSRFSKGWARRVANNLLRRGG